MGIHTTQSSANTTVRYSAFLGMLYVSNQVSEAAIQAVKNEIGEAEVKKGFQGNRGDSTSARALSKLREQGIEPVKVSGILTSARVIDRDVDGRPTPYLTVGMKDDDGRYYLSVDLNQGSAQMLARKLANAEPGVHAEISLFATFGQRPGATRSYADHCASLKQDRAEVKSVDPKESLVPSVNAATEALVKAGISKDDKETHAKRRATVELDFHKALMNAVNEKFTAFYDSAEKSADVPDGAASTSSKVAA